MGAERHKPDTQTLYAQLFESTAAYQVELLSGFSTGLPIERLVRKHPYLYWQLRDLSGQLKQVYLGSAEDPAAHALRDALLRYKEQRRPILDDLKRLTAAYVASGGSRHLGQHFKVVDALARAGLFRAGAVLVGSHAFVSIGAALGVSFTADTTATADVDFCRDSFVSVAFDELQPIDLPGVLKAVDPSFFLVPELSLKAPSTSMKSRKGGVAVDFLTTAKTKRDTKPKQVAPFAALRAGGASSIKADKDRRQAAALILVLADEQPGALTHAAKAARANHDKGLVRDIGASLRRLPPEVTRALDL